MMKKLVFICAMLAWAAIGLAQVPTLQTGIKYLENENFEAALTTFNTIAKSDPKNGTIYYYIGEVSYRTEAYAEAEKAYKKGLDINPQCAECKIGLGKLALDKGKTEEAKALFESAARLDKKNAEVFALIGEAYLYGKNPNGQKAVEYLETAKDMNTKVARYWAHLGDAYKLTGDNGAAMTNYEIAVSKDPSNTAAYISMARIWSAARQTDAAIEQLKKAITLAPDDALPYKDLIEQYIKTGEYEKVTPLLEKYVSLTGSDVEAKVRLVKFLTFQAKDYDRAITIGEEVLKSHPEQYTLHRWLAWAYAEKGMFQQSYEHSKQLFDDIKKKEGRASFPSDYDYWAKAAFKLNQLDSAAHIYRKYLELDPSRSQEIYSMLAKSYYSAKNYEQAIAYYKRTAAEQPLSVADEYYLGVAYYLNDQNMEADSSFEKVLTITPDWAPGWIMRARIADARDTLEPKQFFAKAFYEKYIELAMEDKERNKKNLIDAANDLAFYWVSMTDNAQARSEAEIKLDMSFTKDGWDKYCRAKAIEYYQLVVELDPTDDVAAFNLKVLDSQR